MSGKREIKPCFHCGGLTHPSVGGTFKCYICGQVQETRKTGLMAPLKMRVFSHVEGVRTYSETIPWQPGGMPQELSPEVVEDDELSPDMVTFIRRLTEGLTPALGYSPEITKDILATRAEYRKGLYEVFDGKKDWQEWFADTKVRTKLSLDEMVQIVVDSLEGLSDPDAVRMREGYKSSLGGGLFG